MNFKEGLTLSSLPTSARSPSALLAASLILALSSLN